MSNRRPSFPRTGYRLLEDLLALVRLGLTSRAHLAAENLFLRKQLALYQERRTNPRIAVAFTTLSSVTTLRRYDREPVIPYCLGFLITGNTARNHLFESRLSPRGRFIRVYLPSLRSLL